MLAPVSPIPGGTTTSQLGSAGAGLARSNVPVPAPAAIEEQLTALIGKAGRAHVGSGGHAREADELRRAREEGRGERRAVDDRSGQRGVRASPQGDRELSADVRCFARLPASAARTRASLPIPQDNWNLQADADVPLSDYVLKIAKQRSAAEHSAHAAQLTARAAELTAASNARIQYYSWARARLQQVVAEDAFEQARAHFADAKAEFSAGKASQADLLGVQAEVAQNELLVVRAKNAVALEEDRLRTSLHDDSSRGYEIGEPLLADLAADPGQESFNALYTDALGQRIELRSITETARRLRLQATANKMDILPKLDAIGTAQYANPNPRYFPPTNAWNGTWGVGGAITWSDVDVLLGITNGSANEARAKSTEAQALAMRDGIRDEVMQAFQAVHEAEAAIDSTKQSLAAAEESYRVRRALFRADRATSTELSDSENALTRARFDVVNARIDLRVARVRLLHATGRDDSPATTPHTG